LFDRGRYLEAAQTYQELARRAASIGLERAPTLFLQAGRARILGSETEPGLILIRRAFRLLLQGMAIRRFLATRSRVVDELRKLNLNEEALRLERELDEMLRDADIAEFPEEAEITDASRVLPVKCPFCGANLFPDEMEDRADGTSVCGYCGSRVEPG
jgi:hypothetical protein